MNLKRIALVTTMFFSMVFTSWAQAGAYVIEKTYKGFSIDGGDGSSRKGVDLQLWRTDYELDNHKHWWVMYKIRTNQYLFRKYDNSLCFEADLYNKSLILEECDDSKNTQLFNKVKLNDDEENYQFVSVADPSLSLRGPIGLDFDLKITLEPTDIASKNQHWTMIKVED